MSAKTPSENALASTRGLIAEALRMRTAAEHIPFLPEGLANAIVDQALGDLRSASAGDPASLSLTSPQLVAAVTASFNGLLSQFSEPQRQALRLGLNPYSQAVITALGLPGGLARLLVDGRPEQEGFAADSRSGRRFSDLRDVEGKPSAQKPFAGLGLDEETVSLFGETGLRRSAFDTLKQHYSLDQIKSAASYSGELGVNATTFAGKFIRLDQGSRDDFHAFVDQARADPSLTTEDKRREIGEYRRAHPKIAKVLSDGELLTIVNAKQRRLIHQVGEENMRAVSTSDLADRNAKAGTSRAIADLKVNVTKVDSFQSQATAVEIADDGFGVAAGSPKPTDRNQEARKATTTSAGAMKRGLRSNP